MSKLYKILFNDTSQQGLTVYKQYIIAGLDDVDALAKFGLYLKEHAMTGLITGFEECESDVLMVNRFSHFQTLGGTYSDDKRTNRCT